jgi:REP element-mobilizing transposase RayT
MARPRRIKHDTLAHYHLMSRTNNRRFLFRDGKLKTELVSALRRTAEFCGIELKAYTAMDNHFHVVVKVIKPKEPVDTAELLRRIGVLKGEKAKRELSERWQELLYAGYSAILEAEQKRLRDRMHDISEFIKLFKETFDRIYKRDCEYFGSIWSGRFTSTLIQAGEHLSRCMKYVMYNPVRAGIVTKAKDYCWSWCENKADIPADSDKWCMKRIVQFGAGELFGDEEFVITMAFKHGDRFQARSVTARAVAEVGYATHGWRLAERDGRIIGKSEMEKM